MNVARPLAYALEMMSLPTAPCNEGAVSAWVGRFVARRPTLQLRRDRWGNLLVRYPGRGRRRGRALVFCAHMDHPGFTALGADAQGRLRARWMGGVPPHLLDGRRVRFVGERGWVKGRIVSVATLPGERATADVAVETNGPVPSGAVGMWDFPDARLAGARLIARGCDDVGGAASLISFLDAALRRRMPQSFHVLFTRAEEWGFLGAVAACRTGTLPKDAVVISIETSKELPNARQGDGPIIRVGDRAMVFAPEVAARLTDAAEGLRRRDPAFRFQRRLMDGGICEASVFAAWGYATGGLCLPLGNYHNVTPDGERIGPEYIDVRHYLGLVRFYRAVVETFRDPPPRRNAFRGMCLKLLAGRRRFLG